MDRLEKIEKILENLAALQSKNETRSEKYRLKSEKEFQTIRELQAKRNEEQAKRDEHFDKKLENLAALQANRDEEQAKRDEKLDKKLEKLSDTVGSSERNKGSIIEDLFYNSFEANNYILNHIQYDYLYRNEIINLGKNKTTDIDIMLTNGSHIALIEVKSKSHRTNFDKLDTLIEHYKIKYPYEKRKFFIYLASFCFYQEIKEKAIQKGYGLLSISNNIINVETKNIKEFSL